jgi:two-component system, OmpR family, sensor histidine kinase MprB
MTFRARLTSAAAAAVALAIAIASVAIFVSVRSELRGQIDDQLEALGHQVSSFPAQQGPPGEPIHLPVGPFGADAPGFARVVDSSGAVVGPTADLPAFPVDAGARAVAAGTRPAFFQDLTIRGTHVRMYTTAIAGQGQALQIGRSLSQVDTTLSRLALVLVLVTAGGIAVAIALGLAVTQTALAPLKRLTQATERVTDTGDLSQRIEAPGTDELARLAGSFDAMLEALESSVDAQRQLVADASHELRTPLTSLRTNIEVLERSDELPRGERDALVRDVVTQLEELSALVADVVELARGAQEPEMAESDVRLDELVAEAVERAGRHAPEARFEMVGEPCVVRGDAERLQRAIGNLLDNAVKWNPPGDRIHVEVRAGTVTVRDHGPGIAQDDLPRVFDRFYRSPAARGTPGSGLGLAIAKQVADTGGGSVSAENASDGGAILRINLPSAD